VYAPNNRTEKKQERERKPTSKWPIHRDSQEHDNPEENRSKSSYHLDRKGEEASRVFDRFEFGNKRGHFDTPEHVLTVGGG
jgi:hypothetical protein